MSFTPEDDASALQRALDSQLGGGCASDALRQFYAARGYQPIWWDGRSPSHLADELVAALRLSADDGLDPSSYDPDALARALHDARPGLFRAALSPEGRAQLELRLSAAFLALAGDLHDGRVSPARVDWGIRPDAWLPEDALAQVAQEQAVGRGLEAARPTAPGYARLRRALAELRRIDANGGWPRVSPGHALGEGDEDDRVLELRARLRASGELAKAAPGADPARERRYDHEVAEAVRTFQRRHGLEDDGELGPRTLEALNVPLSARIAQVELNLERWRWMPSNLGERFVIVNAASFELDAFEEGHRVLHSAIVVGKPDPEWQTPVLADSIKNVDVNPDWHVPTKIEREEVIPRLEETPDFLEANGIRVVDRLTGEDVDPASIAWTPESAEAYELVQDAGPDNPLGDTRLWMGNRLGIYLHGTPTRDSFQRPERALSHGCIRVEKISELTEWVLSDDDRVASYQEQVVSGEGARMTVPERVPVYLTYFTAYVDEDGALEFRPDVYGRDPQLQRAIEGARPPSARCRAAANISFPGRSA